VCSGVTALEAADDGLVPTAFVAVTRNVYALPVSSPVTVFEVLDALTATGVWATAPRYGVTV
jgi:hypothetical protein